MSASQYREYNNKLDREAGIKPPLRAEHDRESMFASWFNSAAGAGFGVFENQTRADVKRLIFEHLDEEEIRYSIGAVQRGAEYLHAQGVIHRESDFYSETTGEFVAPGARLIVHPKSANPLTSAPRVQPPVWIVERTQRFTIQQICAMSGEEYARNLQNPDALFNDR